MTCTELVEHGCFLLKSYLACPFLGIDKCLLLGCDLNLNLVQIWSARVILLLQLHRLVWRYHGMVIEGWRYESYKTRLIYSLKICVVKLFPKFFFLKTPIFVLRNFIAKIVESTLKWCVLSNLCLFFVSESRTKKMKMILNG